MPLGLGGVVEAELGGRGRPELVHEHVGSGEHRLEARPTVGL